MKQKSSKETRQKDSLFEAIADICKTYNDRVIIPAQKKSLNHQPQHQ